MNRHENKILIRLVEKVSKVEERTRCLPQLAKQVDVNTTTIKFFKYVITLFVGIGTIVAIIYNKIKGG